MLTGKPTAVGRAAHLVALGVRYFISSTAQVVGIKRAGVLRRPVVFGAPERRRCTAGEFLFTNIALWVELGATVGRRRLGCTSQAPRLRGEWLAPSVAGTSRLRSFRVMQATRRLVKATRGMTRLRASALVGVALGTLALLGSRTAQAERISGQLNGFEHLRNPVWTEAKEPSKHGYTFRELVPTVPAKFRQLFPHIPKEICVAALSTEPASPTPSVLIRIGGGRTTPVTIVVPPRTKLTFRNTDPFTHRLYAV